jgi:uncharacterized LabA/DUF88 family protein
LVDEANFAGAARNYGRKAEWLILRDYLANPEDDRLLIEMVAYVGLPPDFGEFREQRTRKQNFVYWLQTNGFLTVTKDGSPTDGNRYKANVDVILAVDGVQLAVDLRPDIVVLVTGDGDFAHLAQTLRRRGIRVEVAAVAATLSNSLKAAANDVIDLTDVLNRMPALNGDAALIGDVRHLPEAS